MRIRLLFVVWSVSASAAGADLVAADPAPHEPVDGYRLAVMFGEYHYSGVSADAQWGLGDWQAPWYLRLGGGYSKAESDTDSLNVRQGRAGVAKTLGKFVTSLDAEYRSDDSAIETSLLRLGGTWRGETVGLGASYARRRIDVSFSVGPLLARVVDTEQRTYSNEYGASFRVAPNALALYASGSYWDYSEDVERLGARLNTQAPLAERPLLQDSIRRQLGGATFRSLRLAAHLLKYSAAAGLDYKAGDHLLNLEYAREQETLTDLVIQSVEIGWTLPAGDTLDLELRLGGSDFEAGETAVYGTVVLTWYR